MKTYISTNPNILNGKPVITGTRITISQILFLIKEGYTLREVHQEYPNVSVETLEGVMDELNQGINNIKNGSPIL